MVKDIWVFNQKDCIKAVERAEEKQRIIFIELQQKRRKQMMEDLYWWAR